MKVEEEVRYGDSPLRHHHVPPKRGYDAYRDCLRLEFEHRCVYCLSTEQEVGPGERYGGFEIEHFRPKGRRAFRRFKNQYTNLFWACHACNNAKRAKWPTSQEQEAGYRWVELTEEPLGEALRIVGEEVEALNPQGEYTSEELFLNSDLHRYRRRERRKLWKRVETLRAALSVGRERASSDEASLEALQAELDTIEAQLTAEPWDAPVGCLCHEAPNRPTRG